MKNVAAGANPMELRKGIEQATDTAVAALAELSQPVEGKQGIAQVARFLPAIGHRRFDRGRDG